MGASVQKLAFQPPPDYETRRTPASETIRIKVDGGNYICALFINNKADVTVLFSHGNAEDIGQLYHNRYFHALSRKMKVNFFMYDYEGYGGSDGEPSEPAFFRNIEAAFDFLRVTLQCPTNNVVLYGRSIGSGPTIYLASKCAEKKIPLRGVILQSPLLSIYRVAFNFRFSMLGDTFCNVDRVGNIRAPVLIMHGRRDDIVPFWHGQELYSRVAAEYRFKPLWLTEAGHNDIEVVASFAKENVYEKSLANFLRFCSEKAKKQGISTMEEQTTPDSVH
eukprot:g1560.t1